MISRGQNPDAKEVHCALTEFLRLGKRCLCRKPLDTPRIGGCVARFLLQKLYLCV